VPGEKSSKQLPAALLSAAADTLRQLGPRRFSLTAVAEAAGVSRGTVHNAFGTRDAALTATLDHLSAKFIETMAAEVDQLATLAEQVAAAAVLISAHRRGPAAEPRSTSQGALVLLLDHGGDDLMQRSVAQWIPLARAAQRRGEIAENVDVGRAAEWIVRMLFSFELLPPMRVNLENPRAIRRFVSDHIINGMTGGRSESP
jgi:AcrR family transcriptional regulator